MSAANVNADWYYYDDSTAEWFGPVSQQQLQSFARNGSITPATIIETATGQRGNASQLPWLTFPPQVLPQAPPKSKSDSPFVPIPPQYVDTDALKKSSVGFFGWLFDFGFKNLVVIKVFRLIVQICYVICVIEAGLSCIFVPGAVFVVCTNEGHFGDGVVYGMFAFIACILAALFYLCCARLFYEFAIFLMDWLTATKKAAELFIDDHQKR